MICSSIDPPLRRFIHHRENIPRRVRRLPPPAAAPHPSGSPGILPPESRAARPKASAVPDPSSPRTTRSPPRPLPRTFVTNKFRRADAHIRQKNRVAITPARRTPKEIRHERHDRDILAPGDKSATPLACAAAVLPCDPRVTVIHRPAARRAVTSRISASIWIRSPADRRPRRAQRNRRIRRRRSPLASVIRRRTVQFIPEEQRQRPRQDRVRIRQIGKRDAHQIDRSLPRQIQSEHRSRRHVRYPLRPRASADLPPRQRIQRRPDSPDRAHSPIAPKPPPSLRSDSELRSPPDSSRPARRNSTSHRPPRSNWSNPASPSTAASPSASSPYSRSPPVPASLPSLA